MTNRRSNPFKDSIGRVAKWMVLPLLLSGCVSMMPRYETPELPVAERYATDAGGGTSGIDIAVNGWRDYFTDPFLQSLITQALDNNRDLRMAVLNVEAARAVYRIQRADQFPSLGVQGDMARSRTPGTLNPLLTGQSIIAGQYQVGFGVAAWELDFWGRVRSLKTAALEEYLATDEACRASALQLIAQVAASYLTLRETDERIALARATVVTREESRRIFTRRVQVGATSRLDLKQVETLLAQAQALSAQLEQSRAAQIHALELLVGASLDLPVETRPLGENELFGDLHPGLPSDLLVNRPDIVAAEHQLKSANANIGAARAAFFPRITLTGLFGSASNELDGLFKSGSRAWNFSPNISLPIFDSGRRRANLKLSQVQRDMAVANYEKTVQSAFRDVSDALSAHRWLTEQLAIAKTALDAQSERARLSQLRYDNGAAAFLEVLDAQRDLLIAQQQLVQVRSALLNSRISLYSALGGGSLVLDVE
ncbi:MAG: efflux transporter outer membrane subunit [Xanthomonadaceae bacterium]|jgi:multidrug efflux system outer membrane protein|nr:efflux transporter outer membrane subunit [Xanthomonadaceae bacterium]